LFLIGADSISAGRRPTAREGLPPLFARRLAVLTAGEIIYLLSRERQSRAMANQARDPAVKRIHTVLAEAYARRAHENDRDEAAYRASA
jgi:hypothetical protein